jgi:recombinational DNA repair protein RecR
MATLKTSLFNLTETAINAIKKYRESGILIAEDSKQASRIEICTGCPNLTENTVCKLCGCLMNYKVRLEASKCPADKW